MLHISDSSLSPSEVEERQVERLINKETPPSRKTDNKKGPKHDNRRRRIREDDSDMESFDSDMSLASIAGSIIDAISTAASYGTGLYETMFSSKTSSFHGVIGQGHPSGPTDTGYKSYDKRYFGKEHYDSIVATAKDLMKDDWLKYGWDGGSDDAPFRAALDLAINSADSSLYQSKIDAETYDLLLNRLAGWDHDQFSETVIPEKHKSNRNASVMKNVNVNDLLRIATELRQSDPRSALEIVKVVRSIRTAQEEQQEQEEQDPFSDPASRGKGLQQNVAQKEQKEQQEQQSGSMFDKNMSESVEEGIVDLEALKAETNELTQAEDIEAFLKALESMTETLKKKKSASRVAAGIGGAKLESILDAINELSEEDGKALLNSLSGDAKKAQKLLESDDIEGFMKALDNVFSKAEDAAKKVTTSSVRIKMSTLVRLAQEIPETRSVLLPILAAKKKKTKPKKTSNKSKKKDEEDEGKGKGKGKGKKAPFGGKKAPPFGKKKASTSISVNDMTW